jgi:cytochrome P450
MALYPEWYQKLRDEVDEAMKAPGYVCKRPLPMIDSFINESLRLYPPVFFGAQRETPPQGMTIGDTFIPGNTLVSIPPFTVQRGM